MINEKQTELIIQHLKPINPDKIGIFGSFARNESTLKSDLDILVFVPEGKRLNLLTLIDLEQKLSESLGIKVDLVTERSLSPLVRAYVERDLKIIFG